MNILTIRDDEGTRPPVGAGRYQFPTLLRLHAETIAASSAAEQILANPMRPSDEEEVVVRVHLDAPKVIDNVYPRTLLAARLSMQFNVALVLHRGFVLVSGADDVDPQDPVIRKLLPRIKVVADTSKACGAATFSCA